MTNPPGAMPPLPEPFGHIHDGNGNQPLSFDRGPIPWERSIGCSTQEVYSFAQLQAYAAPLIARVAELQADAERWRFSMRYQKRYEETPELRCEAMDEMWRKVIREHRRAPTVEEYEAATDAAIAALKAAKD